MQTRNTRLGLIAVCGLPGCFTAASCCWPRSRRETMDATPLAGVNLAIWYGFGLIVAAIVLALIYGWACREDEHASQRDRDVAAGGRP